MKRLRKFQCVFDCVEGTCACTACRGAVINSSATCRQRGTFVKFRINRGIVVQQLRHDRNNFLPFFLSWNIVPGKWNCCNFFHEVVSQLGNSPLVRPQRFGSSYKFVVIGVTKVTKQASHGDLLNFVTCLCLRTNLKFHVTAIPSSLSILASQNYLRRLCFP